MKQFLSILFLCFTLTACATDMTIHSNNTQSAYQSDEQKGVQYLLGRGVSQNNETAFYYFKRAAENDNPFAQNELAYLYFAGKGTTQDLEKAFYWYQKAAEAGLANAQYNLGLFYLKGIGTQQNVALAKEWFMKSANKGFAPAKKALVNI